MTRQNDETPSGQGKGFQETEQNGQANFTAPEHKTVATLIAKFALAGHVVHKGTGGDFLVCKCGLSRWCENLPALQEFAKKLGVKL